MSTIDDTLALVKELYSHSIINSDDYYSEKLLQVIIFLSTLNTIEATNSNISNDKKLIQDEIAKVKRKVPKWMKKTHQYNYQILKAFMELSDNNSDRVEVEKLEKYVDIGQAFLANYNNLKTISEKNHGKVFEEIDREVELWEPVTEFIENLFEKKLEKSQENVIKIRVGEFVKEHIDNIIDYCAENKNELDYLQTIEYSRDKIGLGVNYSFIGLSDNVEYDRYWTKEYNIHDKSYKFCSQFGGSLEDEAGLTRSEREGEKFKEYLINKDILLSKYTNKEIKFIVS